MRAMHVDLKRRLQTASDFHEALGAMHGRAEAAEAVAAAWKLPTVEEQERALKAAVEKHASVDAFRNLAAFYSRRSLPREALQVLRDGVARCAAPCELLVELAMVYRQCGRIHLAIEALEEAQRGELSPEMRTRVQHLLAACQKAAH
jgi:hypothetical protein